MPLRVLTRLGLPWALALALQGCVTVYHPLVSLQRPVAINPELANFDGMQLTIRCQRTDYTDTSESEGLCQNLKTLFTNQGAKVDLEVPESDLPARDPEAARPDLILELSSRLLHSESSILGWILCIASATLIPAVGEVTFAQDVLVRDADGFLLSSDSLQGRFLRYVGVGFLGVNWLMDVIVRPKDQRLTGGAAKNDFSRDFYAQLSQLALQGRMRARVLRSFDPTAALGPVNAPPAAQPAPSPAEPAREAPAPAPIAPVPPPRKPPAPQPGPAKKPSDPDSQWAPAPFPQGKPQ